jgi:hypothetical protein
MAKATIISKPIGVRATSAQRAVERPGGKRRVRGRRIRITAGDDKEWRSESEVRPIVEEEGRHAQR